MPKSTGSLLLEQLMPRLLLAGLADGVEPDGDEYHIKLTGPGLITNSNLESLVVSGTTLASSLSISVTQTVGDGLVSVGSVTTTLADLGRLTVQGDLGALDVARLNQLEAESLGLADGSTKVFSIGGDVTKINVPGGIHDSTIDIAGNLNFLQAGRRQDQASNISNSTITVTGDIQRVSLQKSLTAGSHLEAGGIAKLDIDGSIVNSTVETTGDIERFMVDGGINNNSDIHLGGNLNQIKVGKNIRQTTFTIDGNLRSAKLLNDLVDSTLLANSIDQLNVTDDLNNTRIGVTGDLVNLRVGDSQGLTLRISGTLHNILVRRELDQALVSALNEIGTVKVGRDLNRTTIMGGIDIGADFAVGGGDDAEWGNVFIHNILVRGDMIDSSIAAGVSARGSYYGDGDDEPTAGDVGTARLNRLIVKGEINCTHLPGETFAISAADGIDLILSQSHAFEGTDGVLVQQF